MTLQLAIRSYAYSLSRPLRTASGAWQLREGWLLRLTCAISGQVGWGEVAPLDPEHRPACARALSPWQNAEGVECKRDQLEALLPKLPAEVGFALGASLAELDGVVPSWLPAPSSACLLPAGPAMLPTLDQLLATHPVGEPITVKWKVAAADLDQEWSLFSRLLDRLPHEARLRLDANAGWARTEADRWAGVLEGDPRLDWLEQPLAVDDLQGLQDLAKRVPVALDESLLKHPVLREQWQGWQVRRPLLEGDPRLLLRQLQQGRPRLMLSTVFETGIGFRWLALMAGLQQRGPTPVAPGLAPGWRPEGRLFSSDPEQVWAAAALDC
ncbi:O-succinylbenzoate synthase [Synechococcus sp. BIOS-U3-1]|uniref:o-succinylbenzoate synthase n=1 Tax=Synechococcus sp. BIOS-U3-1 TaxID=1400865 RepID=UPI000C540E1F|nr:o-succinylbenzoate synthase [Synechococcus sp. BIOS-U3-1]MAD67911.1 o-succinylbenzoate synthase [Synechococcus sp. CPC100]QNI60070.1 O-succinylbenzoate synthase [Synechococcus sp. BIOS-U3-1]|tara:strand:+ start:911 stop:1888 length:978 start_codon:yes stop_codon:yes gene_type:complete